VVETSILFPLLALCQKISSSSRPCEMFRYMVSFCGEKLLPPRPTPIWKTTLFWLPATACWMNSQLPSISGGRFSIRNVRFRSFKLQTYLTYSIYTDFHTKRLLKYSFSN